MPITLTPDQVVSGLVGFFSISGMVVYGLKKNGLISFGSSKDRRKCPLICTEHKELANSVQVLFEKVDKVDKKLDSVSESVQHIRGFIEGSMGRESGAGFDRHMRRERQ